MLQAKSDSRERAGEAHSMIIRLSSSAAMSSTYTIMNTEAHACQAPTGCNSKMTFKVNDIK